MKKAYAYGGSLTAIALVIGVLTYDQFTAQIHKPVPVAQSFRPAIERSEPQAITAPAMIEIPAPADELSAISKNKSADKRDRLAINESKKSNLSPKQEMKPVDGSAGALGRAATVADIAPPPPGAMPLSAPYVNAKMDASSVIPPVNGGVGAAPSYMSAAPAPGVSGYTMQPQYEGNDKFEKTKSNPVKVVTEEPVSTFSIDVDTSSYSFIRRTLNLGSLPPKDSVRVEEMVNYFDYNYALPETRNQPFKPSVTVYPSPWHKGNKLVHIGIKGFDIAPNEKPRSNLVFLIDTSGSMSSQDKLPLLISSLSMLVNTLDDNDTISIVTYAGWAGTALEPTKVKDKNKILSVLQSLQSGGGTAGAAGIEQAYALAERNFDKSGVNRVILATDGDFNVGITDPTELQTYIEKKRDSGVFLSVLGFGQGNYNDSLMQKLAQNGNGNAAYIDNINEARKVLVQEASSTLFPIAKDVKIQVEFNKDKVSEYRLVGYETRLLAREDFNNDKIDAGEIGSGHAVTAIYEITPKGEKGLVDEPRYGKSEEVNGKMDEYGFLKIRYKLPKESTSKLLSTPIYAGNEVSTVEKASPDVRFSTAVAAFGQMLHGDTYVGDFKYDDVEKLATSGKGEDKFGYRAEFINMVKTAKAVPVPPRVTLPVSIQFGE